MALLCSGRKDTWPLEHRAGVMGILRQSCREESDLFGIDTLVPEGCNLDTCHRAGYLTVCMLGAGPKAPGIGSAAAEGMVPRQRAAHSLRTGYWTFLRGKE